MNGSPHNKSLNWLRASSGQLLAFHFTFPGNKRAIRLARVG